MMNKELKRSLSKKNQKGATMIEYALLASLVAVAAVTILGLTGGEITDAFETVCSELNNGTACS